MNVYLAEAYTDEGLPGVWITACTAMDYVCAWPIARIQTDEYGLATLDLPGGATAFDGTLKITAPAMPDNYISLAGRHPTYGSDAVTLTVYTTAALSLTYAMAGLPFDAQHGLVHVDVGDCSGAAASGVRSHFEGSQRGGITTGYCVGDGSALSRTATVTDGSGAAFAFGVVPGPIAVLGELEGTLVGDVVSVTYAGNRHLGQPQTVRRSRIAQVRRHPSPKSISRAPGCRGRPMCARRRRETRASREPPCRAAASHLARRRAAAFPASFLPGPSPRRPPRRAPRACLLLFRREQRDHSTLGIRRRTSRSESLTMTRPAEILRG